MSSNYGLGVAAPRGVAPAARTLWSVQCLRAIAALMIVMGHGQTMVAEAFAASGRTFTRVTLLPWGASIDLFFVISGFVMVHASRTMFGRRHGARAFLLRRFARIAPLYWLVSALYLLLLAAASLKGGDRFPGAGAIAASFAFLPFDTWGNGRAFPVYDLGWTLNYEFFFYVLFAVFVGLQRRGALTAIGVALAVLALFGSAGPSDVALRFWTRPILLDFALGLAIGALEVEGVRLRTPVRLLLAACGITAFAADPAHLFDGPLGTTVDNGFARVLAAGLPAAAVLAAAVLGAEPGRPRAMAPLVAIGNASYSLYLLHPLTMIVVAKLMQKLAFVRTAPAATLVGAVLLLATLFALASFRWIERPLNRLMKARLAPGSPVRLAPHLAGA